jgi:hypothetical protein
MRQLGMHVVLLAAESERSAAPVVLLGDPKEHPIADEGDSAAAGYPGPNVPDQPGHKPQCAAGALTYRISTGRGDTGPCRIDVRRAWITLCAGDLALGLSRPASR